MTSGSRPTVFVSSTVYDFADLRSCISHFFERIGYRVQLSENAAFDKPILPNSYEACFDAIRRADAFVLLVGGRRGGWFDSSARISITQQEYRVALQEAQSRGLRLVICVRSSTWAHAGILKKQPAATWVPSELVDDPQHLLDFLAELGQSNQMRAAAAHGARPAANWIHQFSSFGELVSILEIALRLTTDVSAALLREMVAEEVSQFASELLREDDYAAWLLANIVGTVEAANQIPVSMRDLDRKVPVPIDTVANLTRIVLSFPSGLNGSLFVTETACTSATLAEVEPNAVRVRPSVFQSACRRVLSAFEDVRATESLVVRFIPEAAHSNGNASWPLTLELVASTLVSGIRHATALLEAENLVRHIRFDGELQSDPAQHLRLPVLPALTKGRPLRRPDGPEFELWVKGRTEEVK